MNKPTLPLLIKSTLLLGIMLIVLFSCSKNDDINWPQGMLNHNTIQNLRGFPDWRDSLLNANQTTTSDFLRLSTDSAWSLSASDKSRLLQIRDALPHPSAQIILQKVVALQDAATYMNNVYGGTVGGFVSVAADVKQLTTMNDIYYGLRLDYPGTKFMPNGAGYAVIRFTSHFTEQLQIPFCKEMGGSLEHAWPSTGGGFTASTLGDGGYPEYQFQSFYLPDQGAELYEVTPNGYEILRATFQAGQWTTTEPETKACSSESNPVRNGIFGKIGNTYYRVVIDNTGKVQIQHQPGSLTDYSDTLYNIQSTIVYKLHSFRAWSFDEQHYLLTTSDAGLAEKLGFELLEQGLFGKTISRDLGGQLSEEINPVFISVQ